MNNYTHIYIHIYIYIYIKTCDNRQAWSCQCPPVATLATATGARAAIISSYY